MPAGSKTPVFMLLDLESEYWELSRRLRTSLSLDRNFQDHTPWQIQHAEATRSGYAGTLDEYAKLYKYAKAVLAQAGTKMSVSPVVINSFRVSPITGPNDGEFTVLDTFKITNQKSREYEQEENQAGVAQQKDLSANSSESWVQSMHRSIEQELQKIPSTPLYEAHLARQAELDVEMGARRAVTIKKVPTSVTLPSDAKKIIEGASWKDDDEVLITKFNIEFRRRDLNTLISPHWLNDEVINFYMQLLSERAERNLGIFPSIHVFSTFFYPKLRDRGYQMVRTSTRRINPSVLSRDLILFPIHLGMHWCMATIDFRSKTISYYDSLHATNLECLSVVEEWLARESMDKASTEFDFTGWTKICLKTIPAQQNGYDCGVFALVLAEHITRDASFSFSQKDMLYWRDRISYEILLGKLLDIK